MYKKTCLEVQIASHHRRNITDIPSKKFKFYFDKTIELIKNSRAVICHNSLACQIAVLYKKPIIFITSNYFKAFHFHSHILTEALAKELGSPLININDLNKFNKTLKTIF